MHWQTGISQKKTICEPTAENYNAHAKRRDTVEIETHSIFKNKLFTLKQSMAHSNEDKLHL